MKKIVLFILLGIFTFAGFSQQAGSCKSFALEEESRYFGKSDYISDGKYYAQKLMPGDNAQLYKPFFRGKKYKVVALCSGKLDGIKMEVRDFRGNKLLYQSEVDSVIVWEHTPERSSNYRIIVSVPRKEGATYQDRDCVVILVGFKSSTN